MASLAGYLKELAQRGTYNQNQIVRKFEEWLLEDRYMILAHEREKWLNDDGEFEYVAVKCAKRGNDVYVQRVEDRLRGMGRNVPNVNFNFEKHPFTRILFVTLTYDTKLCSFHEAWQEIAQQLNLFKERVRKEYGPFSVFRTFEAFANGYPHIHAIFIFDITEFKVFPAYEAAMNGKLVRVWRIDEKRDFEPFWHSNIDIKAVYNLKGGLEYLEKYIMKCSEYTEEDRKGVTTLAMCWVFRKKAFYVSGQFRKALSDLITAICSSKTRKIQVDLFNNELKANPWRVLGFVGASLLGLDGDV